MGTSARSSFDKHSTTQLLVITFSFTTGTAAAIFAIAFSLTGLAEASQSIVSLGSGTTTHLTFLLSMSEDDHIQYPPLKVGWNDSNQVRKDSVY